MSVESVEELVERYLAYLKVKKGRPRSEGHVVEVSRRVRRMVAGAASLEDVSSDWVERRMHELLGEVLVIKGEVGSRSRTTINYYRRDVGSFFRWLVRKKLAPFNPVEGAEKFDPEDVRGAARPFSPNEAAVFFEAISPRRMPIYLFWATSGLRPAETGRLLCLQAVLDPVDGGAPYVAVLGSGAKNRKPVKQPLHPDVVLFLRARLEGAAPGDRLFPRVPTAKTFLSDLRRAGLAAGRVSIEGRLSRTSLRKLFATEIDRQGATEGQAQKLMRHSTPELTRRVYTHHELAEKAAIVGRLSFLPEKRRPA